MPWRVGRDLRHLCSAAHHLLERSRHSLHPLCLFTKPIHARASGRAAVASKLSHSHAATRDPAIGDTEISYKGQVDLESMLLRWKKPCAEIRGTPVEPKPPPEVLAVVDTIFSPKPTRLPTLQDLRESPASAELLKYLRLPQCAPTLVRHLLGTHQFRCALWVLRTAKEIGYNFSPKFYGEVIEKLADHRKWRLVLPLTKTAQEHLGYTTTYLLNWRLQALMEIQHFLSLQEALDMYAQGNVRPSRLTYHLLIAMQLRNHHLDAALAVVRAMESAGFRPSPRTWAVILLGYRPFGLSASAKSHALTALQTADRSTATVIINSLVQLCLDAHDMSGAVEILSIASQPRDDPPLDPGEDTIREDGVSATRVGDATTPTTMAVSRGALVDVSTYNILLNYLARQGDLVRSMQTLDEMRNSNILPDDQTAVALVRLYHAIDSVNDALHIVSDALKEFPSAAALLPRLGFQPTIPPTHPIFSGTARPTISLFNTFIAGTLVHSGLSGLKTVLHIMRITAVQVDNSTLGTVMSYLHHHDRPRPRELIRAIRLLMSAGCAPTTRLLHVMLAAVLREERVIVRPRGWTIESDWPEAVDWPTDNPQRDGDNYSHPTAGLQPSRRLRYRALMRPIIQSLTDRGVRSDRVAYALRIKHDAVVKRDPEMALASFQRMVDLGMRPNEYHYGALMEAYTAVGDMSRATKVMQDAMDAGVDINVKTYTILITGYARLGQARDAAETFRRMVAEGIRPDVPAIDALTSAFFRAKAYGMARRVLLQMWPQVAPLSDDIAEASLREMVVAFRALHHVKSHAPPRLSSREQRMLRWMIRDILIRWKVSLGYPKKEEKGNRRGRTVVPFKRTPKYTRAKTR
ncbi:hypothetical protein PYCCODRAFT_1415887 [Trametes coccinea BRFM310]|uniref:Pentacotripeptide-repeat region of PRORP domain-containing protein n=1 Tax=Trametes coccinea (strain BRFM310) TaxID=1353009 RepID=A0A1Y2IEE5_TRAC3|nr:hypothetical protein PYCCODRAFT_1415887 [Trametes coccinea BRFM310]